MSAKMTTVEELIWQLQGYIDNDLVEKSAAVHALDIWAPHDPVDRVDVTISSKSVVFIHGASPVLDELHER